MDLLQTLLGVFFVLALSCGGWVIWGITQSRQRKHELAITREREQTKREQLRLESQERIQDRADRIYLDAVRKHTGPDEDTPTAPQ